MSRSTAASPFDVQPRHPLWNLFTPSGVGTVVGAALAAYPSYGQPVLDQFKHQVGDKLPEFSPTQDRMYLAVFGFLLGYGFGRGCYWLRCKLIRLLLSYTGWVSDSRSYKTKMWAIMLKVLRGPPPFPTFAFQRFLPKMPLPDLNDTLDRWLLVSNQLLNKDEYECTKEVVEEFRKNEGPILQKFLTEKSEKEDSWIHKYWLNGVYLGFRESLLFSNYFIVNSVLPSTTTDPVARASLITYSMLKFAKLLQEDKLPPVLINDLVPLCMSGYRHMFNTNRVPGEYIDEIQTHPGNNHVIFFRKGYYFKVDLFFKDTAGSLLPATPFEIRLVLEKIIATADSLAKDEPPIAALTGQKRSVWHKQRLQLMEQNKESLDDIESALFMVVLDHKAPKDYSDFAHTIMCGRGNDRWFDKSFNYTVFDNAYAGFHTEHSGLDGMVIMTLAEYLMTYENYENGDVPKTSARRPLPDVKRVQWNYSGMEDAISNASKYVNTMIEDVEFYSVKSPYGKGFMKKQKLSPDGFVQMVIQLAHYKLYQNIVKTYEPSTGRLFTLGRTETVNPVSSMSVSWVKSMMDPEVPWQTKQDYLKRAIGYQSQYRLDATVGKGCDRHLFALMCASRENGMDLPRIFMDKAWQAPYILSTSQTPCRTPDNRSDIVFKSCLGGFLPAARNGYGVAYAFFGEDVMTMTVSSYKSCDDTSSVTFGKMLEDVMTDLKVVMSMKH